MHTIDQLYATYYFVATKHQRRAACFMNNYNTGLGHLLTATDDVCNKVA